MARFLVPLLLVCAGAVACGSSHDTSTNGKDSGAAGAAAAAGAGGADGGTAGSGGAAGNDGGAGAAGSAGAGGSAIDGGLPTQGISTSTLSLVETETNLAVADNGYVAATWIGIQPTQHSHSGYTFSKDGGQSWLPPQKLDAPGGRTSSDPVVAAAPDSSFYLAWIAFQRDAQGNPYDMRVYVSKAAAGDTTFGAPADIAGAIASDAIDKPWVTVAPDGTVYVTWLDTGNQSKNLAPRMRVAVSEDQGQTWKIYPIDSGQGGFRNLIYPCVDDVTGRVYVTYHPGGGIGLRWSDDKGQTWPGATAVASQSDPQAMFDDPTCAAHNGEVWVAYGIGSDPFSETDNARSDHIRVAYSSDAGQSIAERYFAEDATAGTKFMHAQMVREAGGALDILYYAGSDKNPDPAGSVRLTRSTDKGKTWATSLVVRAPITFLTTRGDQRWLGDYIGLAAHGGKAYGSFADNVSGTSHINVFSHSL